MVFLFEKLNVYQKALDFADEINNISQAFPKGSWYFVDQRHIQLASATDGNLFASKVLSIISYQKFINLYFQRCYHILKS